MDRGNGEENFINYSVGFQREILNLEAIRGSDDTTPEEGLRYMEETSPRSVTIWHDSPQTNWRRFELAPGTQIGKIHDFL